MAQNQDFEAQIAEAKRRHPQMTDEEAKKYVQMARQVEVSLRYERFTGEDLRRHYRVH